MVGPDTGAVVHLVAELSGLAPAVLHDQALLGGLLIAAVRAAGLHVTAGPLLRTDDTRGVDALLLLQGGHAALHAYSATHTLIVDLLAAEPAELGRALDVITRRLAPEGVNAERLIRVAAHT